MKNSPKTIILTLMLLLGSATAAVAQRSLTITSAPEAKVWVDGVYRGATDDSGKLVIKPLLRGVHKVVVRAKGFNPLKKNLTATQLSLRATLTKATNKAELAYQEGEALLSKDKFAAIEKFEEAIALRPRFVDAFIALARTQVSDSDPDGALATIKKLRRFSPRNAEASAIEARIYRSAGNIDGALNSFERAIREGRGFQPEAHTGIALILKNEAENASSSDDEDLAKLYYIDAAKSFETAIKQLSATEPVVYLLLGQIYEKMGEKRKAIGVYQRFIRDMPNNDEVTAVKSFIEQLQQN